MRRISLVLVSSLLLGNCFQDNRSESKEQQTLKVWSRNTYPGPRHKASDDFPPYQGSDRSEWMTFFQVSPADPTFMLTGHNMSGPLMSVNGREFKPVDLPLHRWSINAAFSPHDGNTGFLLQGHSEKTTAEGYPAKSVLPGIWRTKDKGKTWEQIYKMAPDASGCRLPAGKRQIAVDPHPDRSGHIYYGSHWDGLLRTTDDGVSWETAAFGDYPVKTIDAVKGPDDKTILYVIVGEKGVYGRAHIVPDGKLYRVEVEPDSPFGVSVVELPWEGDFVDVAVSGDDWSKGLVIRNNNWYRGGSELIRFTEGGTVLATPRTASEAGVGAFVDLHINPQNPDHVVVRCHGAGLSRALQYSMDGGQSWNEPHEVVDGHIPSMISYNPASHKYPDGAMPNVHQQGQGPAVGFDATDPKVVYWWTQNFNKTPLKSTDYGATWKPFAYGGPFKQDIQIAIAKGGKHMGVGRGEYGFLTTRDGGLSWTGSTHMNDDVLREVTESQPIPLEAKYGRGLAYKPDDPDVVIALYGFPPAIIISKDGGLNWQDTRIRTEDRGSVYWSQTNPSVVYAANMRSRDAGVTWQSTEKYVLALSSANENLLVGNRFRGDTQLSISIDGGESWTPLPEIPNENWPGTEIAKSPISLLLVIGRTIPNSVAIDPGPRYNPAKPGNEGIRILVAGRRGVYEYKGKTGDPGKGAWSVLNRGFEPSIHFSRIEPVSWIGFVSFDPRPGMEHLVYACVSSCANTFQGWCGANPNMVHTNGTARHPLYRSVDGGQTWEILHAPEYTGIPDHLDVTAMTVGPDGTLYAGGYTGLYILPGIPE